MRTRSEVIEYAKKLKKELKLFNSDLMEVYIIPDFMSFDIISNILKDVSINIGLQDIFWEDYGSYAGEVSPLMLRDLGCRCVYMGHSERKIYFKETNEIINKKVLACYRNRIIPFLFVGETRTEFEKGITNEVLREQLEIGLNRLPAKFVKEIVIIYEPRWAIGQKDAASPKIIEKSHYKVREIIADLYTSLTAKNVRILYGGSINLENLEAIIKIPEVDGIGSTRSSLNPINFLKMISLVEKEAYNRRLKDN